MTRAQFSASNPGAQLNKWKRDGQIFAINHNGTDYYPAYGLDAESGVRPLKALSSIIHIFDGKKDAWGMAYWFHSVNSFLGGQRPMARPSLFNSAHQAPDGLTGVVRFSV